MEATKPKIHLILHTDTGFCTAEFYAETAKNSDYDIPAGELFFEGHSCEECLIQMLNSQDLGEFPPSAQWYYYLSAMHRSFPYEEPAQEKELSKPALLKTIVLQYEEAKEKFLKRIGHEMAQQVKELENTVDEIKDSVAGSQVQDAFYQSLQEYAANRIS